MAELLINHAFVSAKPDSPDTSLVSSSEWNAPLVATGGQSGQIVTRDTTVAHGVSLIEGVAVTRTSDSFSGNVGTTPGMASVIITCQTRAFILVLPHVNVTVAVGNIAVMSIRRNGTVIATGNIRADALFYTPFNWLFDEVAGTYTYDLLFTGQSGNVTNVSAVLSTMKMGHL